MSAAGFKFVFCALILALPVKALAGNAAAVPANVNCDVSKRLLTEADQQFRRGQYLLSAVQYSQLRFSACDSGLVSHAWVGYAFALGRLDEVSEVLTVAGDGLANASLNVDAKAKLAMLTTWTTSQPSRLLTADQMSRWLFWRARDLAQPMSQAFEDLHINYLAAPQKSVWIAGLASAVVPGVGQAYSGHWQTAALSLFVNALFLGTTTEFIRHDQPWAAAASGTVFSIVYLGNVVSAVQGAKASNAQNRDDAERVLQAGLLPELSF